MLYRLPLTEFTASWVKGITLAILRPFDSARASGRVPSPQPGRAVEVLEGEMVAVAEVANKRQANCHDSRCRRAGDMLERMPVVN